MSDLFEPYRMYIIDIHAMQRLDGEYDICIVIGELGKRVIVVRITTPLKYIG